MRFSVSCVLRSKLTTSTFLTNYRLLLASSLFNLFNVKASKSSLGPNSPYLLGRSTVLVAPAEEVDDNEGLVVELAKLEGE